MLSAGITHALESAERRGEDLRQVFTGGAQPNYADVIRDERAELTGDPLSVVVPRGALLITGDAQRPAYTRDGSLAVRDGVLVDSSGAPVLGFAAGDTSAIPRSLQVEKNDLLLDRVQDARVEPDGVFGYARTVVDPATAQLRTERVVIGTLALARFPAATNLHRVDATHVRGPSHLVPVVGTPNDGDFAPLRTQRHAVGRLDPDATVARLQDAYLALRALSAEERTRNAMIHGALDLVK